MPDVAARSTHSLSLPIPLVLCLFGLLGLLLAGLIVLIIAHSSGARRSRCVLGRTEEAARPSSTSVAESSRRTPVEFEKTIAVIFLPD